MKKLRFLNIISAFLIISTATAQVPQLEWAFATENQGAPTGYVGTGLDLCLFGEYVYVAGTFAGTADFDPGAGVFEMTSFGLFDIYVQKLDTNGNFIWARQFGGQGDDGATIDGPPYNLTPIPIGLSMNTTSEGDLILTGTFHDSIDCDPDPVNQVFLYNEESDPNITAGFVLKLSDNGDLLWAKKASSSISKISSSAIDSNGNIYNVGWFFDSVDLDPSENSEYNLFANSGAAFVQKLNADGELDWAVQFGDTSIASAHFVEADNADDIVIMGTFRDTVDFDPSIGEYLLSPEGETQISSNFICKLDGNGNLIWAGAFEFASDAWNQRMVIDDQNNIYITQVFSGTIDVDPTQDTLLITGGGWNSTFLSKVNSTGTLEWVKVFSGGSSESSSFEIDPSCLAVDGQEVIVGGSFWGNIDLDPGTSVYDIDGDLDGFVLALDDQGSFRWAHTFSTDYMDVRALIASNGSLYGTGYSVDGVNDCDPSVSTESLESDMFVFKWTDRLLVGVDGSRFVDKGLLSYYPNPTVDFGWIRCQYPTDLQVQVYSSLGQLISTQNYPNAKRVKVKLGGSPGIYHVVVISSRQTESFKVIKN